ncbi:acyl-CoA thioesterase [Thalassotalea sp. PLHSN55]|uniref:acyl-CoA thioesterase n=1 Tax=Thalassotalea sp. PLHSN55 TaxID=3435888 RepID=UPI003F86E799
MYPLARFMKVYFGAKKKTPIHYLEPSSIEFRCHPWDLDMFNEMNNGRVMTLYDLGRFDLSFRNSLFKVMKQHKWAMVVAGSSVRYRKRIMSFDKITMHSQCVGSDDKWIYMVQSMWVKGEPCSSVLVRGGITSRDGLVSPEKLVTAMGFEFNEQALPLWVQEWIDSEQHRPWPPVKENI